MLEILEPWLFEGNVFHVLCINIFAPNRIQLCCAKALKFEGMNFDASQDVAQEEDTPIFIVSTMGEEQQCGACVSLRLPFSYYNHFSEPFSGTWSLF